MPGPVERLLRDLAGHAERPEVDEHEVVVGAARHDAEALGRERRRRARRRCATISAAYSRKSGCAASWNATAFAAITCMSGPPCRPGNTALSIAAAYCCAAQDRAGARAAQRLVRRERDDVGVRDRRRVRAAGDEAGDVRGVDDAAARRSRRRSSGTPSKSMMREYAVAPAMISLRPLCARRGRGSRRSRASRSSSSTPYATKS